MVTAYDVPADRLIARAAEKLKEMGVEPPGWASWVTTGIHRERAPEQDDWWYIRLASVLRKVYIKGPIGTSRLAAEYGGKVDRGSERYHPAKGSRCIVRKCLQQLESLGLVESTKEGRVISSKGRSFLDNTAREVMDVLVQEMPEMKKYVE